MLIEKHLSTSEQKKKTEAVTQMKWMTIIN